MSKAQNPRDSICPSRMAKGLFGLAFGVALFGLVPNAFNAMASGPAVAVPAPQPVAPSLGLGL